MTDPSRRPLSFPKWHIPYLEKHRILELFHEVARELVIQKPEDHLLFMKQILQQAAASIDVSRIVLIGSPKVNKISLADEMAKVTNQIVISTNHLITMFGLKQATPKEKAKALACLVRSQTVVHTGWIISDCINTEEDAKAILKYGVLPTHVFLIIPPFQPKIDELLYCDVPEHWPELRRNLFALRDIFKKTIREIPVGNKNLVTLAQECIDISKLRNPVKRVRPRVVIIGPRGVGRKTQAKLLSQIMGLVHVDFEYILCQAWTAESELGQKLRQCHKKVCFHSELLCQIVNKRILEDDCLKLGWVLTGYPYTEVDFQFLDSLQTPPNRVIIMDCDLNVCKERIRYRQINAYTGSSTNLLPRSRTASREDRDGEVFRIEDKPSKKILKVHPKDRPDLLQAEHEFYCHNYGRIKKYCGDTAMVVNGDQNERWVYECISAHVVGANPTGPPRKGFGVEIPEICSCDCIQIPPKVTKAYTLKV